MRYSLESIPDTIKAHPTETVAVVAAVSLIGVILYYRHKQKRLAIADTHRCNCNSTKIGWFSRWLEYRNTRARIKYQLIA